MAGKKRRRFFAAPAMQSDRPTLPHILSLPPHCKCAQLPPPQKGADRRLAHHSHTAVAVAIAGARQSKRRGRERMRGQGSHTQMPPPISSPQLSLPPHSASTVCTTPLNRRCGRCRRSACRFLDVITDLDAYHDALYLISGLEAISLTGQLTNQTF